MKFQTKDMDNIYISMFLFMGIIDQTTNALIIIEIGITNTVSITISTVKLYVVNISVSRYYPTLILNPSHELIKQNNTAWKCRRCCCRRMRGRGGPPMGRGMMRPNFRPGPPWVSAFFSLFFFCALRSSPGFGIAWKCLFAECLISGWALSCSQDEPAAVCWVPQASQAEAVCWLSHLKPKLFIEHLISSQSCLLSTPSQAKAVCWVLHLKPKLFIEHLISSLSHLLSVSSQDEPYAVCWTPHPKLFVERLILSCLLNTSS